ncbi:hypothetical protein [Thermocrinis sp.]
MLGLVKEPFLLAFLIISYNFALIQLSYMLEVRLYPVLLSEKLHLIFFLSVLYVAWLFGERLRTVAWIGVIFVLSVFIQSVLMREPRLMLENMPAFLITLLAIKLFESPVEKRLKALQESKHKLEEELVRNQQELIETLKTKQLYDELLIKLSKEKEELEKTIEKLTAEEEREKERLLKEKEEIAKKLNSFKETLRAYEEKVERLTQANRRLFEMIETQQERLAEPENKELSKLRSERKKLIKELLDMEGILDELMKENSKLKEEKENLQKGLQDALTKLELAQLGLEQYRKSQTSKKEVYKDLLELILENITWEEKALEDFIGLDRERKKEFLKELLLLNMKDTSEVFESLKKNIFKLKPKGGRIYFTHGKDRNWHIIGILDAEDDKHKNRFIRMVQE